jgi:FkbM family methyltransferase
MASIKNYRIINFDNFNELKKAEDICKDISGIFLGIPVSTDQKNETIFEYQGIQMKYSTPNETTYGRVASQLVKETTTIEWLNKMNQNEVLFDIGANIGIYTIFPAMVRGVNVYSFEPQSENFSILNQNIYLNNLCKQVKSFPLSISDYQGIGLLNVEDLSPGKSGNQLGLDNDNSSFIQGTYSVTLDSLLDLGLPIPDYIKIDVDGIESKVINGGRNMLKHIKSLLVEVDADDDSHKEMIRNIQTLGFEYNENQVKINE